MNNIFQPYLDKFVVVYLDDIVVYSSTLEEHAEHLWVVFKVLQDNELYVKREKCLFTKPGVDFLGQKIRDGTLFMDKAKVKAIAKWEPPIKVMELRSFLGLVNYYKRFIKGYSTIAAPLIDLLKKTTKWEWIEMSHQAFDALKKVVKEELVLVLPNHSLPFEVHVDASDFVIKGVLMQKYLITFES